VEEGGSEVEKQSIQRPFADSRLLLAENLRLHGSNVKGKREGIQERIPRKREGNNISSAFISTIAHSVLRRLANHLQAVIENPICKLPPAVHLLEALIQIRSGGFD